MNSALAREVDEALATVSAPLEGDRPVAADVGAVDAGYLAYRAYWQRAGIVNDEDREYFGPTFRSPREAEAFADQVNRRTGPKVGDPVVVDGTKYRIRMGQWGADDRLDCRTSFGNRWVTVRAADLEWDDVAGVWRERGW